MDYWATNNYQLTITDPPDNVDSQKPHHVVLPVLMMQIWCRMMEDPAMDPIVCATIAKIALNTPLGGERRKSLVFLSSNPADVVTLFAKKDFITFESICEVRQKLGEEQFSNHDNMSSHMECLDETTRMEHQLTIA